MKRMTKLVRWTLIVMLCGIVVSSAKEQPVEQFEQQRQADAKAKREAAQAARARKQEQAQVAAAKLPEDTSAKMKIKEIRITGNTLLSTEELLADMPFIFNASNASMAEARSEHLYDFRALREVARAPGTEKEVTARTVQGFTQYVLSVYQRKNYGGIYVYVPAEAMKGAQLADGILPVSILEARVISVGTKYYDVNQKQAEKGYLDANYVLTWSPAKPGKAVNSKKLDDFVNLLNANPDRYVSTVISKGEEPNTLAVNYGIYEVNPWHYFFQIDNSGVEQREWTPRVGIINTNLLGFDDSFFAMYQAKPDSTITDNYSLFGSYDFPLAGPKLRLNIFGGYSEFDISPQATDFDFIGGGKFIGANLRYNFYQTQGWFFDAIASISEERSKTTAINFLGDVEQGASSNVRMKLWGLALDIHKRDDMSNTSLGYKFTTSMGGSSEAEFNRSFTGAERDFTIHYLTALHSRLLDPNKVTRLSKTVRWVITDDRLTPAKKTPVGGFYSVRGYKEYERVADGAILASVQYEFDLIRYEKTKGASPEQAKEEEKSSSRKFGLKRLAPAAFLDFGRARINKNIENEPGHETFVSAGPGVIADIGDNFNVAVYLGIALKDTDRTDAGSGRVNVSFLARW